MKACREYGVIWHPGALCVASGSTETVSVWGRQCVRGFSAVLEDFACKQNSLTKRRLEKRYLSPQERFYFGVLKTFTIVLL